MKTITTAIILAASITSAHACKDSWKPADDKLLHAGGSVVMGAFFTALADDPFKGMVISASVGAMKEVMDMGDPSHCASFKDFGYDLLGSAIGAYGFFGIKGLVVTPRKVAYSLSMNLL